MSAPHVLFISGSAGLGHVTRDLALAAELRARCPDLRLSWLVAESDRFTGETPFAEELAGPFSLPMMNPAVLLGSPRIVRGLLRLIGHQRRNVELFRGLTAREHFDLIVGDEAYDLMLAVAEAHAAGDDLRLCGVGCDGAQRAAEHLIGLMDKTPERSAGDPGVRQSPVSAG